MKHIYHKEHKSVIFLILYANTAWWGWTTVWYVDKGHDLGNVIFKPTCIFWLVLCNSKRPVAFSLSKDHTDVVLILIIWSIFRLTVSSRVQGCRPRSSMFKQDIRVEATFKVTERNFILQNAAAAAFGGTPHYHQAHQETERTWGRALWALTHRLPPCTLS